MLVAVLQRVVRITRTRIQQRLDSVGAQRRAETPGRVLRYGQGRLHRFLHPRRGPDPLRRESLKRLQKAFDERGIGIPFPHLTVYAGSDNRGRAPPIPLNVVGWSQRATAAAWAGRRSARARSVPGA